MSKVVLDITMSLDGFIAGPNDDVKRLHDWLFCHAPRRRLKRNPFGHSPDAAPKDRFYSTI